MHWVVLGVATLFGIGYAADKTGEAIEATTKPVKWLVAGGTVYVAYKALQASGAIK